MGGRVSVSCSKPRTTRRGDSPESEFLLRHFSILDVSVSPPRRPYPSPLHRKPESRTSLSRTSRLREHANSRTRSRRTQEEQMSILTFHSLTVALLLRSRLPPAPHQPPTDPPRSPRKARTAFWASWESFLDEPTMRARQRLDCLLIQEKERAEGGEWWIEGRCAY